MSIAAYARVSTHGQNEASQVAEIRRYLTGHGLDASWYVDKASGTNLDRPEFKRLQADIFSGSVRTVIVWKLDRLSRSLSDGITTITDWLSRDVRLVATSQQLDFSGPTGKLIASVLFSVAEMEQETRRERQAAGIEAAKARGVYTGRKNGTTKAKPQRAKQLAASGLVRREIATAMGVSERTVTRYLSA